LLVQILKSKGNQDQFSFNERIEEALGDTNKQLERLETALAGLPSSSEGLPEAITQPVNKAKASIEEGTKLLLQSQKHIRLADRSEFGWRFVKEYESDQLADNEDDEKRIIKAEKAAEKKLAVAKKKKLSASGLTSQGVGARAAITNSSSRSWYGQQGGPGGNFSGAVRAARFQAQSYVGQRGQGSFRPIGPCFRCGEMGHLQNVCPKLAPPYPLIVDFVDGEGCGEHPERETNV
jgi:hypothetical protein